MSDACGANQGIHAPKARIGSTTHPSAASGGKANRSDACGGKKFHGNPKSVGPKHAPHARRTPFALLVLGLIVGGMSTLLALNTASAANEVRRHDIANLDQSVAAQLVQLQNDVQASAAPANLASAAAALGMVPAGNPAFLEIAPNGTVRVLGSAAPASAPPVYVRPASKTKTKTKPKPKPTAGATKTATTAKASTTRSSSKSGSRSASKSPSTHTSSAKKRRTPTPTPTPNTTLPGGTR